MKHVEEIMNDAELLFTEASTLRHRANWLEARATNLREAAQRNNVVVQSRSHQLFEQNPNVTDELSTRSREDHLFINSMQPAVSCGLKADNKDIEILKGSTISRCGQPQQAVDLSVNDGIVIDLPDDSDEDGIEKNSDSERLECEGVADSRQQMKYSELDGLGHLHGIATTTPSPLVTALEKRDKMLKAKEDTLRRALKMSVQPLERDVRRQEINLRLADLEKIPKNSRTLSAQKELRLLRRGLSTLIEMDHPWEFIRRQRQRLADVKRKVSVGGGGLSRRDKGLLREMEEGSPTLRNEVTLAINASHRARHNTSLQDSKRAPTAESIVLPPLAVTSSDDLQQPVRLEVDSRLRFTSDAKLVKDPLWGPLLAASREQNAVWLSTRHKSKLPRATAEEVVSPILPAPNSQIPGISSALTSLLHGLEGTDRKRLLNLVATPLPQTQQAKRPRCVGSDPIDCISQNRDLGDDDIMVIRPSKRLRHDGNASSVNNDLL